MKIFFLQSIYTNKLLNDKNLSVSKVKEEIGELIEAVEENSNKIHEASRCHISFNGLLEEVLKNRRCNGRVKKKTKINELR